MSEFVFMLVVLVSAGVYVINPWAGIALVGGYTAGWLIGACGESENHCP